jgi:hypothetical protein
VVLRSDPVMKSDHQDYNNKYKLIFVYNILNIYQVFLDHVAEPWQNERRTDVFRNRSASVEELKYFGSDNHNHNQGPNGLLSVNLAH